MKQVIWISLLLPRTECTFKPFINFLPIAKYHKNSDSGENNISSEKLLPVTWCYAEVIDGHEIGTECHDL